MLDPVAAKGGGTHERRHRERLSHSCSEWRPSEACLKYLYTQGMLKNKKNLYTTKPMEASMYNCSGNIANKWFHCI